MGMVDYWSQQLGVANKLGSQLPWNVSYFVASTSYPKSGPSGAIQPADILVFGDPNSSDTRLKYAHIGVATTPGKYISMYNYGVNVIEKPLDHIATMQLVLVFSTGFTQESDVPSQPLGTVTGILRTNNDKDIRGSSPNGIFSVILPLGIDFPVYGEAVSTLGPVWRVSLNNVETWILQRNAVFTPIGGDAHAYTVTRDGSVIATF